MNGEPERPVPGQSEGGAHDEAQPRQRGYDGDAEVATPDGVSTKPARSRRGQLTRRAARRAALGEEPETGAASVPDPAPPAADVAAPPPADRAARTSDVPRPEPSAARADVVPGPAVREPAASALDPQGIESPPPRHDSAQDEHRVNQEQEVREAAPVQLDSRAAAQQREGAAYPADGRSTFPQQRHNDQAGRRQFRNNGGRRGPGMGTPGGQAHPAFGGGRPFGPGADGGQRASMNTAQQAPRQPAVINPRPPKVREPRPDVREPRPDMRTDREMTPVAPPVHHTEPASGYLVALNANRFVLRGKLNLHSNASDVLVNPALVRNLGLRPGDLISGTARPPRSGERLAELVQVETVNDVSPEAARNRPRFDALTPTFPNRQIVLERPGKLTGRVIDLISPIGFGSRVLIVSPPKAGKTTVLKEIALAVEEHYPDAVLILCLVGERPEEVTDLRMTVKNAEVISSTFDEAVEFHVELAELTIERAKRLVEMGKDVVLLLDSITRLTRAYNLADAPQGDYRASGRTLSGGIDANALYPPKRFFGAARACLEGGSLTVIASCLVDTGSRMEDVIYEELKGTGNSELVLDRHLAEERIYPAIDINRSSTRREDLLLPENVQPIVVRLRRALAPLNSTVASRFLIEQLATTPNNDAFVARISGDRDWARSVPRGNGEEDLGFGQRPGRY